MRWDDCSDCLLLMGSAYSKEYFGLCFSERKKGKRFQRRVKSISFFWKVGIYCTFTNKQNTQELILKGCVSRRHFLIVRLCFLVVKNHQELWKPVCRFFLKRSPLLDFWKVGSCVSLKKNPTCQEPWEPACRWRQMQSQGSRTDLEVISLFLGLTFILGCP